MGDVNEDKKDELQEVKQTEEKVEETKKADLTNKNKKGFLSLFKTGIIDTLITLLISAVGLCILGIVFRYIFGYNIIDVWGMLFVVYLVIAVFYPAIKNAFLSRKKHKNESKEEK